MISNDSRSFHDSLWIAKWLHDPDNKGNLHTMILYNIQAQTPDIIILGPGVKKAMITFSVLTTSSSKMPVGGYIL